MSYDIVLMEKTDAETWDDALSRLEGLAEGTYDISVDRRSQFESIVADLLERDPTLERFDNAHSIELSDLTSGLQVFLSEHEGAVSVPYWHSGPAADEVMRRIDAVVAIVTEATGWRAYDPQLERELVEGSSSAEAASSMTGITEMLHGRASKPWWKFWG